MGRPKTLTLPGEVVELFERVRARTQEKRGTKAYPYQVIGELCRRWLDEQEAE